MDLYKNDLYMEDVRRTAELDLPWERFRDKAVLISGATGLVGSFLVDVLMQKNLEGLGCKVYALGRSEEKAKARFGDRSTDPLFSFLPYDINLPFVREDIGKVDFVLHLASNTHPMQYSTDPIGTITTNIIGLQNMLEFACAHGSERFAFASSNEIYGENRGDAELFDEEYCGYIDCNTLRAGYPESKRCGEALCRAYEKQKGLSVCIPRLTRSYGPTMLMSDTKAISQFIRKGIAGEDIVLKSAGTQYYSYTYVADAVSGLLTVLLLGEDGAAYNIADESSDMFEIPDAVEAQGYSKATKARLDGAKLRKLGWKPFYDIKGGIRRTMQILGQI